MRLLIATFVALVVSAGAAMPAAAGDISVVGPRNGGTKSVSFESLAAQFDVDDDYVIRGASGATQVKRVRGISVARLLAVLGADEVYSGIDVVRPGGGVVRLSKIQLLADGQAPVIFAEGDQLVFVRPSYNAEDANASDVVSVGAMTLKQVDLGALSVSAKASRQKVKVGELVTFTGTASGGGAGESYKFTWIFKDGKSATGASVSHRFKRRGTYEVLLAAGTVGSDRTDPDVVVVQVGAPVKSKKKRVGGGTNDAAGAPTSGAAEGDARSGDLAATEQSQTKPKRKKKRVTGADEPTLEQVSGQVLLSSTTEPLTENSNLAARSGSQQPVDPKSSGLGISTGVWAAIAALLILAFGAALENGKVRLR
ncbi:MAG: PKD domain-containing protein [Solirubrobacterales bacterium]|nr:PKD domain-containing protein [Solirubrobacterales bacterium]